MIANRHGTSVIEFPSELEIVTTRAFDAPLELVFDVLTKAEHVRNWFAPFKDQVTECSIDLRVGGDYHIVFVTPDGKVVVPANLILLLGDGEIDRGRRVVERIVSEIRHHRMLRRLPVRPLVPTRR